MHPYQSMELDGFYVLLMHPPSPCLPFSKKVLSLVLWQTSVVQQLNKVPKSWDQKGC